MAPASAPADVPVKGAPTASVDADDVGFSVDADTETVAPNRSVGSPAGSAIDLEGEVGQPWIFA